MDEDPAIDFVVDEEPEENEEPEEIEGEEENVDEQPIPNVEVVDETSSHVAEIIIVKKENRCTSEVLSKYEITEIISVRAEQIARNNNPLVDVSDLTNPIDMAQREFMARRTPLIVRRYVGMREVDGKMMKHYEDWNVREMSYKNAFDT